MDLPSFASHGFRLDRPPRPAPPIYLAALRPDMLRLAAREADGVMLSLVGVRDLPRIRQTLADAEGAAEPDVVLRIGVWPTTDCERARAHCRRLIAAYLTVPAYAAMMEWLGGGDVLEPISRAWGSGDRRAAVEAVPDELVDALFVHGAPGDCRARLEAFREAGIRTPVLSLMGDDYDAHALPELLGALSPA